MIKRKCAEKKLFLRLRSELADPAAFIAPEQEDALREALDRAESEQGFAALLRKPLIFRMERMLRTLPDDIAKHNRNAAALLSGEAEKLINPVEGRRLDPQQMSAVLQESRNHLVIAGAGTGKTSAIVGRVKYLIRSGKAKPGEILLLSFTNAAANEMTERLAKEGLSVTASTFHKFGLSVIRGAGEHPAVTRLDAGQFLRREMKRRLLTEEGYLRLYRAFCLCGIGNGRSADSFADPRDYEAYLTAYPPDNGDTGLFRSHPEALIARFLFANGIRYFYRPCFRKDMSAEDFGALWPDFILKGCLADGQPVSVEYTALDNGGKLPLLFAGREKEYLSGLRRKRAAHKRRGERVIELTRGDFLSGRLLRTLRDGLQSLGIPLHPESAAAVRARIADDCDPCFGGVSELAETVLHHMKERGCTADELRHSLTDEKSPQDFLGNDLLLTLTEPLLTAYSGLLAERGEIDFSGMIARSAALIREGKYKSPYRYVIVDEYQDISASRVALLQALRGARDYDLFCVGDDWQSIYRFAGSNVRFLLDFGEIWGKYTESRIETAYRYPEEVAEAAGSFVMQNPAQIRKHIRSADAGRGFPFSLIRGATILDAEQKLTSRLRELPEGASVFLIGRYYYDLHILTRFSGMGAGEKTEDGFLRILHPYRPDLNIRFVTAHRAKGLQADYAVILNNNDFSFGFPCRITESPITELLTGCPEKYPYAEERRLFYVAVTRARKKTFFMTVRGQEGLFVREFCSRYRTGFLAEERECPRCGCFLAYGEEAGGSFFQCENPDCRFRRWIRPPAKQDG